MTRSDAHRWAVLVRSENRLDGRREYFMWAGVAPLLFRTRRSAREWIEAQYGYIRKREDLRREPHGWKMPKAVKVYVILRRAS